MNGCRQRTSACNGRDVLPVKRPLRREPELMCAGCRAMFATMGHDIAVIERRVDVVPVASERRRFVAHWIRNLTARDNTGEVVAA